MWQVIRCCCNCCLSAPLGCEFTVEWATVPDAHFSSFSLFFAPFRPSALLLLSCLASLTSATVVIDHGDAFTDEQFVQAELFPAAPRVSRDAAGCTGC